MKHGGNQSGQALAELAAALVALVAVILIVLFIAGVGIANIRALKEARTEGERTGRAEPGNAGGAGDDIASWDYNGVTAFTAQDSAQSQSIWGSADGTVTNALNSRIYSDGGDGNPAFAFTGLDEQPVDENSPLVNRTSMFAAAANLVRGVAPDGEESDNFFDRRWSGRQSRQFRISFGRWFDVNVDELELRRQRANIVYFPRAPR